MDIELIINIVQTSYLVGFSLALIAWVFKTENSAPYGPLVVLLTVASVLALNGTVYIIWYQ